MDFSFQGKRALVTGASRGKDTITATLSLSLTSTLFSGIGRAIAVQLAQLGAEVVSVGRSESHLVSLKNENPSITVVKLDICDWNRTKQALSDIGPVDFLVNNAGEGFIKALEDVEEEDVDRIFDLNVKALINVTQIVVGDLLRRGAPGSIVNVSSQAGLVGLHQHTVYCASKGAVDAFTRACALELGPGNIRVNSVNPTVVMTKMGKKWWSEPSRGGPMLARIPLGRFCEVQEVVDAVLFLLSDRAGMITGTCLALDGGFTTT
ncbi:hypothetical protein NQ315_001600 [Exocentrus adspersus]|uniref:L-xylulose reductase n=1 Tax=Exocentrus adspersus TaxID=1586481 RepID=A0AAV8WBA3_9CUCU|nr:hypothetical protein NQ315_001600 [Exocentrus adspersus]